MESASMKGKYQWRTSLTSNAENLRQVCGVRHCSPRSLLFTLSVVYKCVVAMCTKQGKDRGEKKQ